MATFNFNINYPSLVYTERINSILNEDCITKPAMDLTPIMSAAGGAGLSLLSTYTGDPWKSIVLTNITTNNPAFHVKNDIGTIITNVDLPLTLPVTGIAANAVVPNLHLTTDPDYTFINAITDYINISFYIIDENNTSGSTLQSSLQVIKDLCSANAPTNNPPTIQNVWNTVTLYGGNTSYQWVGGSLTQSPWFFKLNANESPTSFGTTNLPSFFEQNPTNGWITQKLGIAVIAGTYSFNVYATNAFGTSAPFTINMTIEANIF